MREISEELRNKCGVYIITNIENGNFYIGSSKNLKVRLYRHFWELDGNNHCNTHLQNAWNKYSSNKFEWGILTICKEDNQWAEEQKYIDLLKPIYNLQQNVNNGNLTDETKLKISISLKEKYSNGFSPRRKHDYPFYVYNIVDWTLVKECSNLTEASLLLCNNHSIHIDKVDFSIIYNKYVVCSKKFIYLYELKNYIYENVFKYKTNDKRTCYLIIEDSEELYYFRTTQKAVDFMNASSASTLKKHNKTSKDFPYLVPNTNYKMYMSDTFIPNKEKAVLVEESLEILQTNIGEDCDVNPEISIESKESIPS